MAATGIKVADEVVAQFNDMKLKKINAKYIIYHIDGGLIKTETVGSAESTFEDFVGALPPNDGRYAVYDCDYTTSDGRSGNKLIFIAWAPDSSPVKKKMIYAGSKDALTSALVGIMVKVTATDFSELTSDILQSNASKFN